MDGTWTRTGSESPWLMRGGMASAGGGRLRYHRSGRRAMSSSPSLHRGAIRAMDQHDLETGVRIGDFRIERRLGAGGMGIVYRARQVSLDRTVALKVLGAALTRASDRTRFQREAQAVARLGHPGI